MSQCCSWVGDICAVEVGTSTPVYVISEAPTLPPTESMCSPGCSKMWLGDKNCDPICMNEACGYDGGDCASVSTDAPTYVCTCPPSWIGNNVCDSECNVKACNYDSGDCAVGAATQAPYSAAPSSVPTSEPSGVPTATYCASACLPSWLGDGVCQVQCKNTACNYDNGDCATSSDWCAISCNPSIRGDGFCDSACNTAACNYDGGDCQSTENPVTVHFCSFLRTSCRLLTRFARTEEH